MRLYGMLGATRRAATGRGEAARKAGAVGEVGVSLVMSEDLTSRDAAIARDALYAHNIARAGAHGYRGLVISLRDAHGSVVGGIIGSTYWGWLALDFLWVAESHRRLGLGKRLLAAAETEAVMRGCDHAMLDTFSFQGVAELYRRCGYECFGVLDQFPTGHQRYYFMKVLRPKAPAKPDDAER